MKRIFLLHGKLGAGKTTFVKQFLDCDSVQSPTFTFCNRYEIRGKTVAHFDVYNQKTIDYNVIMDALSQCDYVFIEWPEMLEMKNLLPFASQIVNIYL